MHCWVTVVMDSTAATVATPVGTAARLATVAMLQQSGVLTRHASEGTADERVAMAAVVRAGKALQATMVATVELVDCSVEPVAMEAPVGMPSLSGRSAATAARAAHRGHALAQV